MLYYYCSAVAALYNDVLYDDRMVAAAAAVGRSWNSIEEVDVQERTTTAHYYSPHLNNTKKLLLLLLWMLLSEEEKLSNDDDDDRPILLARKAVIVVVWTVKRRSSCDAPWMGTNTYVERGMGRRLKKEKMGKIESPRGRFRNFVHEAGR
jgi:hypothetical protein